MASINKAESSDPHDLVTTVVVNWNGRAFLNKCLSSLVAQTYQSHEIILVDNASTDGSADYVEAKWPSIKVLRSRTNIGFAAGNNLAIQRSTGKYVALLNNDAYAEPDWLAKMIEVVDQHQDVGMIACKMLFADRPTIINSTGICIDRVGIAWDRCGGEVESNDTEPPTEIFGPCAGAALYRRNMLSEIGLFDEDFFMYLEDVDLAWRARRSGWRCLYVPMARVVHYHSASSTEGSPFKSFHLGRNKVWLIIKNYPFAQLWAYAPLLIGYDLAAVIYALIGRRDIHALRGRLAGWAGARKMWRKRQAASSLRRDDLAWLSPIEPPWLVPHRYRHLSERRNK
ncbi:MAG TPA: glycosyltransferase family 2 protein [Anaerolineae bacterium]|nr:glycosyltransferase family 2 protein [Anaerolineae bacterium]